MPVLKKNYIKTMKAKEGDVIRFYFSELTGYTKERTNNNTEMVDIVVKEDGFLIAISDLGGGCCLHRLDQNYTILGDVHNQSAIDALIANGWTTDGITEINSKFNL